MPLQDKTMNRRYLLTPLLPFVVLIWLIGWSLYYISFRRTSERSNKTVTATERVVFAITSTIGEEEFVASVD
jgi:hypothetical protein